MGQKMRIHLSKMIADNLNRGDLLVVTDVIDLDDVVNAVVVCPISEVDNKLLDLVAKHLADSLDQIMLNNEEFR